MLIPCAGPFNASGRVRSAGHFPACLLASLLCASWGALVQGLLLREGLLRAWSDWLSEQCSIGVLLLPFLLTPPQNRTASGAELWANIGADDVGDRFVRLSSVTMLNIVRQIFQIFVQLAAGWHIAKSNQHLDYLAQSQ
jgi:hypothetical protein